MDVPDLSQLIEQYKGGRSYMDLQEAAGGTPTAPRFHQMYQRGAVDPATGRSRMRSWPEAASIPGIAAALGVSEETVVRSAMISLGFRVTRTEAALISRLPRGIENLDPHEVEAIIQLVRSMLRNH